MLTITRGILALFLLAAVARAEEAPLPAPPADRNHIFFHPILTGLSAALLEVPLVVPITYERNLATPRVSLVYHPILILGGYELDGDSDEEDLRINEYGFNHTLGLRRYFKDSYRGFYLQASGRVGYSWANIEGEESGNEVAANVYRFGVLAYLGWRWRHIFLDAGGGFGFANGTASMDGDEVELAASGPTLDLNLGFGF